MKIKLLGILVCISTLSCFAGTDIRYYEFMRKADSCVNAYNYLAAIPYYMQARNDNHELEVVRKLAIAHKHLGHFMECISLLKSIPKDSLQYDDLRSLYFSYRNIENADSLLLYGLKILDRKPYDSEVLVSVAAYCNATDKPNVTRKICQKYLMVDSANVLVLRHFGYASYLVQKYQDAYRAYHKMETMGFSNYESSYIMGISLEEMGKNSEAYDPLLLAVQYKKHKDFSSLFHLGKVCVAIGLYADGVNFLTEAKELQTPDSMLMSTLYKHIAEAYFLKHNYEDAAHAFENSSFYEPNNPITYYNIAQMYGGARNLKKERHYYSLFLSKAEMLKESEETKEMIEIAKAKLKSK